jgi:RNA polymerase sigma factor (sigma-70 family)
VWTGARAFRGEASFRGWLFGIAKRKCVDILRKRGATVVGVDDCLLAATATAATGATVALDAAAAAGGDATADSIGLRGAIAELSAQMREAIFLVYYKGLTYEETAEALGIPLGTVRSRIHNAKQKLSQSLGSQSLDA